MGCDIHSYLEKYTSVNGENKWVNVDYWQINPHHGIEGYGNENEYEHLSFYIGRNYDLFGILAGVRSSEDPIEEPRGLPEDVSDVTKREYEKWDEVYFDVNDHCRYKYVSGKLTVGESPDLDGYFGDVWRPVFPQWFEDNTGLEVHEYKVLER